MNLKQRNNLYFTIMKSIFFDFEKYIPFDNGDLLTINMTYDKKYFDTDKKETIPVLIFDTTIDNLDGELICEFQFLKELKIGQTLEKLLKATDIEKKYFIFKKETGYIVGTPYRLKEFYSNNLSDITINMLKTTSEKFVTSLKEKEKVKEKTHKK